MADTTKSPRYSASSLSASKAPSRKLADYLKSPSPDKVGPLIGFVATTYEFDPDFFETDFLPNVLNLGAWDDRNWASRIAMERALAELSAAVVIMDSSCYRARPRSLRVEFIPAIRTGRGALHAKVLLLCYQHEIRLLVGSANLTEPGFRRNIEVASEFRASPAAPSEAPLIQSAVAALKEHYGNWLTPSAVKLVDDVHGQLESWKSSGEPTRGAAAVSLLFGGGPTSVAEQFIGRWPAGELIRKIVVVSPFWSEDSRPLASFLDALKGRGILADGAELALVTDGRTEPDGEVRPVLPPGLQAFDPAPWNIASASVQAVDPTISKEDAQGRDDLAATRSLHAKVVALCGTSYVLLYSGSANFTVRGWGICGMPAQRTNLEAGVMVLHASAGVRQLKELLPRTAGKRVELPCAGKGQVATPDLGPDVQPWPAFLRALTLAPTPESPIDLQLQIELDNVVTAPKQWSLWCVEADEGQREFGAPLHAAQESLTPCARVDIDLSPAVLNHLLLTQEVLVEWNASEGACAPHRRRVPLNVEERARHSLPTAPGAKAPGERAILAYFQGRIAFEDLYSPSDREPSGKTAEAEGQELMGGNGVDTSRIQSYVIREFVEALRGIEQELHKATTTEARMRFALQGPVSPVTLGRMVVDSVGRGDRTPVAGAFQLVELMQCVGGCRGRCNAEALADAWGEQVDEAVRLLRQLLARLKTEHPKDFVENAAYDSYEEAALRNGHQ